jgi:uncharacterized protein (DUF1330 family)
MKSGVASMVLSGAACLALTGGTRSFNRAGVPVTAYVVIDVKVSDPEGFGRYAREAAELLGRYGGRNILFDQKPVVLEGAWQPSSLVIQEFPDAATVTRWYNSPEYQRLKEMRERYSQITLVVGENAPA